MGINGVPRLTEGYFDKYNYYFKKSFSYTAFSINDSTKQKIYYFCHFLLKLMAGYLHPHSGHEGECMKWQLLVDKRKPCSFIG